MSDQEMFDKLRDKFGHLIDPKIANKYGDPFDANDIRNAAPTMRRQRKPDMSQEEEIAYLAQDIEILQSLVNSLSLDALRRRHGDHVLSSIFDAESRQQPGQYL